MKGKSALVWLGLAGAAGAVLFQTSYTVQNREEQLASLNRKIVAEQEAIQILKAEWSYLNDPSRLETLARTHLSLRPTDARQFVASADLIPMRPAPAPVVPEIPPMAGLSPLQTQGGIVKVSAPAAPPAPPVAAPAVMKSAPAAPAKVPAPPAAPAQQAPAVIEPAAAKAAPKAQPAVVKQPQQPSPQTLTPPKNLVPASVKQQPAPPKTDSLGVMIARLGGNR
ncbi:MAG TPA: hypothetical protein VD860_01725 [Azospirillum sp.]|nr:hypothetical protein [Azospirillum sp.]